MKKGKGRAKPSRGSSSAVCLSGDNLSDEDDPEPRPLENRRALLARNRNARSLRSDPDSGGSPAAASRPRIALDVGLRDSGGSESMSDDGLLLSPSRRRPADLALANRNGAEDHDQGPHMAQPPPDSSNGQEDTSIDDAEFATPLQSANQSIRAASTPSRGPSSPSSDRAPVEQPSPVKGAGSPHESGGVVATTIAEGVPGGASFPESSKNVAPPADRKSVV